MKQANSLTVKHEILLFENKNNVSDSSQHGGLCPIAGIWHHGCDGCFTVNVKDWVRKQGVLPRPAILYHCESVA
eukprot:scaffold110956_cov43-Prasinocladus_malaysianus.AAC.2